MKTTRRISFILGVLYSIGLLSVTAMAEEYNTANMLSATKDSIKQELQKLDFMRAEIALTSNDIIEQTVILDYTDNIEILQKSLYEPVVVYEDVVLRAVSPVEEALEKRQIRTYNAGSITLLLTLNRDILTNVWNKDTQSYDTYKKLNSVVVTTSSADGNVYNTKTSLEIFGAGSAYDPYNQEWKSGSYWWITENGPYTKTFNPGNTETTYTYTLSSAKREYISTDIGNASYMGADVEFMLIWKTNPGATDGEVASLSIGEGPGWPS
ncbi:hypothetical protein [Xylanibacter rodentium]|uniref:hypothetical protein n=1 Tax=Xylanibacter rodentium TaxID=2736289 RepID=UPI00259CD5C8|nr:hypothetical protein [Xylanibacter rodentium]